MTIYNFSAGPATLPKAVLETARDEMLDYQGSGMSVLEMSHRSPEYDKIIKDAEQTLRELMAIPDNYKVLFAGWCFLAVYHGPSQSGSRQESLLSGCWFVGQEGLYRGCEIVQNHSL